MTKAEYGENLDENIKGFVNRLKKKSYLTLPVRRTYIDKPGSKKKKPLGIPSCEDKIVQRGIAKITHYKVLFNIGWQPCPTISRLICQFQSAKFE